MIKKLLIGLLMLTFISACKTKAKVTKPSSEYYYDGNAKFYAGQDLIAAIDKAKLVGKPLLVEFEAEWCLPCKIMSEEVFTDPQVAKLMNEDFLNYKVDIEEGSGPNMKFLYNVEIMPTFIVMDFAGKEVIRNNGSLIQTEMISFLDEALIRWN